MPDLTEDRMATMPARVTLHGALSNLDRLGQAPPPAPDSQPDTYEGDKLWLEAVSDWMEALEKAAAL
jgi:hypothetical protein